MGLLDANVPGPSQEPPQRFTVRYHADDEPAEPPATRPRWYEISAGVLTVKAQTSDGGYEVAHYSPAAWHPVVETASPKSYGTGARPT
jgi:hypothetical protein